MTMMEACKEVMKEIGTPEPEIEARIRMALARMPLPPDQQNQEIPAGQEAYTKDWMRLLMIKSILKNNRIAQNN